MVVSLTTMRLLIVVQDVLIFVLGSFLIYRLASRHQTVPYKTFVRADRSLSTQWWIMSILLIIVVQPFINLCGELNAMIRLPDFMSDIERLMRLMEEQNKTTTLLLLSDKTFLGVIANIVVIGCVAAMSEELFFRGALQEFLIRSHSVHLSIWLTAFIFSFIHLQFYGFIPRLILGAILGYGVYWSGSIWLSIIMHFINNSSVILLSLFFNPTGDDISVIDGLGMGDTWWLGFLSMVTSIGLMYYMWLSCRTNNTFSRRDGGSSIFRS